MFTLETTKLQSLFKRKNESQFIKTALTNVLLNFINERTKTCATITRLLQIILTSALVMFQFIIICDSSNALIHKSPQNAK